MTLKTIKTHNIQTHRDVTIELPEQGLVRFAGNNSNGKSVITKALKAITQNSITMPKERKTLITKGESSGDITLERYDGVTLHYHIHLDAAQTYAELCIPDKEPIRRYLSDKSIPMLRAKFGLHVEDVGNRSLNIFDSDDALLFFKTPYKLNYSVLKCAYRDEKADKAAQEFLRVYKESKTIKNAFDQEFAVNSAAKESLEVFDVDAEEERATKLRRLSKALALVEPLGNLPELKPVPEVKWFNIEKLQIPEFKLPLILDGHLYIKEDLETIGREINYILEGECPTCHRKFFS